MITVFQESLARVLVESRAPRQILSVEGSCERHQVRLNLGCPIQWRTRFPGLGYSSETAPWSVVDSQSLGIFSMSDDEQFDGFAEGQG